MAIEAYCVKCKAKKVMQDPVESTTKNGKPITKGKCPDCGTTICRHWRQQVAKSFEATQSRPRPAEPAFFMLCVHRVWRAGGGCLLPRLTLAGRLAQWGSR